MTGNAAKTGPAGGSHRRRIALQSGRHRALFREVRMPKLNRDGVEIYYEVHGSGPAAVADPWLFRRHRRCGRARSRRCRNIIGWSVGHARPRPVRLSRGSLGLQRSPDGGRHGGAARYGRRCQRHCWWAVAWRLHVAGVLSRAPGAGPRAADHRYRTGLQEGRRPRDLEQARPRHRRSLRARGPCGSEVCQPRALTARAIATRRALHAPRAAC